MEFLPFFLILMASVLFAAAFRKFHLPWVLALITAGVVIGPQGFALATTNPTLEFLGELGLIFLMFMAGLETRFDSFKEFKRGVGWLSMLNSLLPLLAGIAMGIALGYELTTAFLLGIIFMSSSIAVIIPTLESLGLANQKIGHSIMVSTVIADVLSLVLLSVLLQTVAPVTNLPLPSFYFLLIVLTVGFIYVLPKIRSLIPIRKDEKDLFESEVRLIFALMIGVVITFELLGLHPIIAGFFAGLVLADSIKSSVLIEKLRTMSYGVFIPIFFVLLGLEMDISVFSESQEIFGLLFIVIGVSMSAKFISGWFGGRISGFNQIDSMIIGVATIPQLSTTLAVAFTGASIGILPAPLVTTIIVLSIITTLIAPITMKYLVDRRHRT